MLLAEDVKDISSRLLLSKGQQIHQKHIRILKIWGVTEVSIEGEQEGNFVIGPGHIEKANEDIFNEVKLAFKNLDIEHPLVHHLVNLSVAYRSRNRCHLDVEQYSTNAGHCVDDPEATIPHDVLKTLIKSEVQLPEMPSVIYELNDIVDDPYAPADTIAQVVNKSQSLTAQLLRIVNSAFYGFPSKIDSISRAVTLVGTKEISTLAIGVCALKLFENIPGDLIDILSFYKHSYACGLIGRMLAAHKNIQPPEQLFVSGLLHDIGRLIVLKYFPQPSKNLLIAARLSAKSLSTLEKECLGGRHTDVARYLVKKWKFPLSLENNIYYHHCPSAAQDTSRAAIIHLADIITHGLGLGQSGENHPPCFDSEAVDQLGLSPGSLELIIKQALHQLTYLDSIFQKEVAS